MSSETYRPRAMRKAMTPPEARMWANLKRLRGEGFQFRRQAPFRGYYLGFVYFTHRLVIEVDGQVHQLDEQIRHDRIRDAVLAKEGFVTLRFDNAAIRDNIGDVMDFVVARLKNSPTLASLRAAVPPHEWEGE
ncbi:endonuclease domain-containing protein [Brevundimonas intermedia]|uniref:endonuclease domain-containing protein n=1 Tax=Brevundimonas intermedia TaxID=74315 RepID=UPI003208FC45